MFNDYKKWLKIATFSALLGFGPEAFAQAVIFPQEAQPGMASATQDGNVFTIKNDLLNVSYTKTSDNKLVFNGWEALHLNANPDIFKIQVDDGTVITSSQMTLGDVRVVSLTPDDKAFKGSLRLPGMAIEADYTYKNGETHDLSITWRAVLRDGSHYLRTEMDIKANKTTDMYAIIPMSYDVNNKVDGKVVKGPAVVGNTRGAVIMNDQFFAALETPTAYNYINAGNVDDIQGFNPKGWNLNSFKWNPARETPEQILTNGSEGNSTPLTADYVAAARGGVIFQEAGPLTVTFNYKTGAKALHIVGVDVMNKNGHIVSSDYHVGKAGTPSELNEYHLNIPEKECYVIRYFVENRTDNYTTDNKDAAGDIVLSLPTREKAPTLRVVFDGPIGVAPQKALFANFGKSARAAEAATTIGTDKIAGTWAAADWKQMQDIPEFLWKNGFPVRNVKSIEKPVEITQSGKLVVDFQYQSGSHGINIVGVDLVDAEGNVVASDYHKGFTGGAKPVIPYTLTAFKGNYTLRYIAEDKTETIDNTGKTNILLTPATSMTLGAEGGADTWKQAEWTAMGSVPQGVIDLGFPANKVKSIEKFLDFTVGASNLDVTFTYASGTHRMNVAGVDVIDAAGRVVSYDYHVGFSGSGTPSNNVYHVAIPKSGAYRLRYIAEDKTEEITSDGNIAITTSAITPLNNTLKDTWASNSWKNMANAPEDASTGLGIAKENLVSLQKQVYVENNGSYVEVTFTYGGGSHGMNLAGVDLVDAEGNVVAADYHKGFTGGKHSNNVYRFCVGQKGIYQLRYIGSKVDKDGKPETITSNGNITFSATTVPAVSEKSSTGDAWKQADWKAMSNVPAEVLKIQGVQAGNVKVKENRLYVGDNGNVSVNLKYAGGANRLNLLGVDLLDNKGTVVASDYHTGFTGNDHSNNSYALEGVKAGLYTVRYIVNQSEPLTSTGNITFGFNTKDAFGIGADELDYRKWSASSWATLGNVPLRVRELVGDAARVKCMTATVDLNEYKQRFELEDLLEVVFENVTNSPLKIAGVELLDASGQVVLSDYHKGSTGTGEKQTKDNVYRLKEPNTGVYTLRYIAYEEGNESINSTGYIRASYQTTHVFHFPSPEISPIVGKWSRNVNLEAGKTWNVSAVIGLVAKDQPRRSVASYVERERAVPWRPYPIYNSWYELNINRNNDEHYTKNMNESQCLAILDQWKTNFFDKYQTGIKAFVWDDGWDKYGTWEFNPNFKEGFKNMDNKARAMDAGTGAWLGPVGGYGTSGNYRRAYWQDKGGMQLSNKAYYDVFYKACHNLLVDAGYDFRYFKFDGISGQFSAVGPDGGDRGNENAEGIIYAELDMRKIKADIFFNTSVGTWASPFWFGITDAVWRQENDYGEAGNHTNSRERWITYRDRLVYQNFVQNSPMCPINNLMTHGFILTDHGGSSDRNYDAIVRELRCAFACGSSMVELYNDFKLMNEINGGALWKELADCIKWQEANKEALPDAHWVGGNPWDGTAHHVYGWAGWNGKNAVLTLRNGDTKDKVFETTLRKALEIPEFVQGSITFNKGFEQANLEGFEVGQPIDIDAKLRISLPASSVYVFDNTQDVKNIDAAKNQLKAAIDNAKLLEAFVGEGTGKYTCANFATALTGAQSTYDDMYAMQKEIDAATKTLNDVIAAAKLNAPTTGKFYRIKANSNNTEANAANLYLSSDLNGEQMQLVAETAAKDAKTVFYLNENNILTACGAMRNVKGAGLDTGLGEAQTFTANKTQLGHYAFNTLVAQGNSVAQTANAADLNEGAWQLVEVAEGYQHKVHISEAGYSTLYAPVALTLPAEVKAFKGSVDVSKEVLKLVPLTGVIPAGTGVVLKGAANDYQFTFDASGVAAPTDNEILGSLVQIAKPSGVKVYTLQRLNGKTGFYQFSGQNLGAGKAYLQMPLNQRVKAFLFDEGDLTGIEEMELTEDMVVYDLAGRRVNTPSRGLYIINGKKVYIK